MNDKALQGVIGSLLTARNDAKKQTASFTASPSMMKKGTFQVVSSKGKGYVLGSEGISCVDHAIDLISSDPVLREHFSRAYVTTKINDLVQTLIEVTDQDLQAQTIEQVKKLLEDMEKAPVLQWKITTPITNLVIKSVPFQVGRATFALMDNKMADAILSSINAISKTSTSPEEVKEETMKQITEQIQKRYTTRSVATLTVEASDMTNAIEHAEVEIEHSLNALRFYSRVVTKNDARSYRMFIGAEGTVFAGQRSTICLRPEQEFSFPYRNVGYFFPYEIDAQTIGLMQKISLDKLSNMLQKHVNKRSEFEKLLVTAVDFFGTAMNHPSPREAYLSFVISLEALLLKEGEPRGLLAERVALVVGESYDERNTLFEQMEKIYTLRSRIVHNGFSDVTEEDVRIVSIIAFQVIARLLSMLDKLNDIGKLISASAKSKFGGPPLNP